MVKHEVEKLIEKYTKYQYVCSHHKDSILSEIERDLKVVINIIKCEERDTLKINLKPLKNIRDFIFDVEEIIDRYLK